MPRLVHGTFNNNNKIPLRHFYLFDARFGLQRQGPEAPGPIPDHADVEGEELIAGGGRDGERVPLELAQAPEISQGDNS